MSIFHTWTFKFLQFYNGGIIWYEKNMKKPFLKLYKQMYDGQIVEIVNYDVENLRKQTVFVKTTGDLAYDMAMYMMGWETVDSDDDAVVSFVADTPNSSHEYKNIYRIVCWDGKSYLTRSGFDIKTRQLYPKRHLCLHASINDKVDITNFINNHPESFTTVNKITILDILSMLLVDGKIGVDTFYIILQDRNRYLYIIDDETLEVRTFKDNEQIVL